MALQVNDILMDVSYVLVEPVVNTTASGAISSGSQIVTPASMEGIYVDAKLVIGTRSQSVQEVVTVTAVTATTFTAVFANAHSGTPEIKGATFPKGQSDHTLFTQSEMLTYLSEAQSDFLLKVRPIYNTDAPSFTIGDQNYTQPSDCIRIERISIAGKDLLNISQADLDKWISGWSSQANGTPLRWFQDMIDTEEYGLHPKPDAGSTGDLWYSQRSPFSLVLDDNLFIHEVFGHYLKYGVLARAFSKDGEQRDPRRADYCARRFAMGVVISLRYMDVSGLHVSESPPSPGFSRFQIPPASTEGGA